MIVIKYFALGDSLTVGFGALPTLGWTSRYRVMTERYFQRPVLYYERARMGARSDEVLHMLYDTPADVVRQADIITITAGGNDLIQAARSFSHIPDPKFFWEALNHCTRHLQLLIHYIERLKQERKSPYIIRMIELYNPFPYMPEGAVWVQRFNQNIRRLENGRIRVARIYKAFLHREPELIALDGLHPNSRGHAVIASKVAELGYGHLDSQKNG
jgi:lysophospholipase L1-like esterase